MIGSRWTRVFLALALALPIGAAAQVSFESVPAAAALRQVLASPAGAGALSRNPALGLVATMELSSPLQLRALTPLLSRLPAEFANTAAEPAQAQAAVAVVERAYQLAAPAALAELDARERELKALPPGPEAVDGWTALAEEARPYVVYGAQAEERVRAMAASAEAARRSAQAQVEAEKTARALTGDAALEHAAAQFEPWSAMADAVEQARRSVLTVNAPAELAAHLQAARERGVRVGERSASEEPVRRLVIDNRLMIHFDPQGREISRLRLKRGLFLIDGTWVPWPTALSYAASAKRYLASLPEEERREVEGELMLHGVARFGKLLAVLMLGSMLLVHYAPLAAIPFAFYASVHFLLRYGQWRSRDAVRIAARSGWTPAAPTTSVLTRPWERILGDATWDPARPFYVRLDAAVESLEKAALPAGELARLLSRLSGPFWSPYLREAHLGLVWRHLSSPDPLAVALAAQFLAGQSAYFLAAYLEARPAEQAALAAYARLEPAAARALRASLADRAAL
jgi:hypothetical protein